MPPTHINVLRRMSRRIQHVAGKGRRAGLSLYLARGKDPGCLVGAPLIRLAKEWWNTTAPYLCLPGTLAPGELVRAHHAVALRYQAGSTWRKAVRGPYSGALWACERVGWHLSSPNRFTDEDGVEWQFTTIPPTRVAKLCARALQRVEVALSIQSALPETAGPQRMSLGLDLWLKPLPSCGPSVTQPD